MYARIKNAGNSDTGTQNANNAFVLQENNAGCCGDDFAPCQYTFSFTATGVTLTTLNLTINGATSALALGGVAATDPVLVRRAIEDAVRGAGYIESEPVGNFNGVDASIDGATLTIVLTGDLVPVSIITSAGTETLDSTNCTEITLCDYTLEGYLGGAGSYIRINGTQTSLGTITPGSTSAASIDTAITNALTAAGFTAGAGTVVVTDNTTDYDVVISDLPSGTQIRLNGDLLVSSDCTHTFTT
jgi:hypothetical protein